MIADVARRFCGHDPLHATIDRLTAERAELADLARQRLDRLGSMHEELRVARAERHDALVELHAARAALAEARAEVWERPGPGGCGTLAECVANTAAAHRARVALPPVSGADPFDVGGQRAG